MKKRHTNEQIVYVLKQAENGEKITDLCRKLGVSEATSYNWRNRFSGMGVSEMREMRQLREENTKLKQLVADLSLDKHMLREVISKNSEACTQARAHWVAD
ncbi:MAG: hypothetical protein SynsKO_22480 [Synoicihabitans sp.]